MENNRRFVLVFTRYNPPYYTGGIERYISNLNKYLIDHGYKVTVIVMDDGKEYDDEFNNIIKIKVPKIKNISSLVFSYKLNKLLNEDDIVNIHYPTFGIMLQKKLNTIYTVHTLASEEINYSISANKLVYIIKQFEKKYLELRSLRKAKLIISLNNKLKQKIIDKYKIEDSRIKIIGNGIDVSIFKNKTNQVNLGNKFTFLYLGRLTQRKNIQTLIEAVNRIKEYDFRLLIAGSGEFENELKNTVNRLGINNIEFIGYKSGADLINTYTNCNVYVLPSFYEGLPFTVLEAMALKKTILLGNFEGSEKLAIKDKTGFVVKENNIESFKDGLLYFLENKAVEQMGENAYNHVKKNYNLNLIMDDFMNIVKKHFIF